MLACGTPRMGQSEYLCENRDCRNPRLICHNCNSRACPTCGKKATDTWIEKQLAHLPDCDWGHFVFTLPSEFWSLIQINRTKILNDLGKLVVDNLLYAAKKRGLKIGIFCVIHTNSRRLTWHPHLHISITLGGINRHGDWKNMTFDREKITARWKHNLRQYLLDHWDVLTLPSELGYIRDEEDWRRFVLTTAPGYWHVHLEQTTRGKEKTLRYLGCYLKRPPISGKRLAHYRGEASLSFRYYDHRTGLYCKETITQEEMIDRVRQHIPDEHFRMVRYYGFLSNRLRGQYLPLVRKALGMDTPSEPVPVTYRSLFKSMTGRDPLACSLCGSPMKWERMNKGLSTKELRDNALDIARSRCVL